jgi:hypothetical protein
MSHAVDRSERGRTALGVALGVVLAVLLPALVTSDATTPAVAALVLALAALLVLAPRSLSRAACAHLATAPIGDAPPLVLPGRATDPVHHPLRPRAPGNA